MSGYCPYIPPGLEDQISSVLHPHFHVSELLNKHLTLPLIYRDIALCMYGPELQSATLTLANVLQHLNPAYAHT